MAKPHIDRSKKRVQSRTVDRLPMVLALMRESGPADVTETIDWLDEAGWVAVKGWGGPPEWEGNASLAVEYGKDEWQLMLVRDRGQWMIDVQPPGWRAPADLQILHDILEDRPEGPGPLPEARPVQIPWGARWRSLLPAAVDWLASGQGREIQVREWQRRRSRRMFPPAPRKRKKS